MANVYVDGCFDLFHFGHVLFLKKAKDIAKSKPWTNSKLIVGILDDKTIESYKRVPILKQYERAPLLESCKYVDKLILSAPLILTQEFIKEHDIGTICIPTNRLQSEIDEWYKYVSNVEFIKISYTEEISTTKIINKLSNLKF